MAGNQNEIEKLEHDDSFHVKKVSLFGADGTGSLVRMGIDGFNLGAYDYVSLAQAATTDTYTFKSGGASGTTIATITVAFTDSTKLTLSSVTKT